MTYFLLMRHAEPDYNHPQKWNTTGWGADLAPLTTQGEKQILEAAKAVKEFNPEIVICSPTTRTLHSALILNRELPIKYIVEFDLHEWVPDRTFQWQTLAQVIEYQNDYYSSNGEYPEGEEKVWESKSHLRARAISVLKRYLLYSRILVVCHGMLIESLTGQNNIGFTQLVPFSYAE